MTVLYPLVGRHDGNNRESEHVSNYEWRLVGTDSADRVSILSTDDGLGHEEIFGPYEVCVSECGLSVPVAMLLPVSMGKPCTACRVRTGSLLLTSSPQQTRPRGQDADTAWVNGRTASLSAPSDDFVFLTDVEPSAM